MTRECHVRFYERAEVQILRATHLVMGLENKDDAQEMLLALKERLGSFGLALHEGKTRLIEFGRFAALTRQRRGERKPETFAFLGFIHYCGVTRDGRFIVKHKTEGKRLTRKLKAVSEGHGGICTRHWPRSISGSLLCCEDAMATMAGRITMPRSTDSTGKFDALGSAA